ncbi:MAG: beta-ketoacyl synthase [Candidatus Velamenicoccus archaeovorus]
MKPSVRSKGEKRRVVVTGLGVVSSLGIGVPEFWKNLIAGKSGISDIESFDTSDYPVHKGGEVKNFHPEDFIDKRKIRHLGRASQMAIAAAKLATKDAALSRKDINGAGVLLGTTLGEAQLIEKMNEQLAVISYEKIQNIDIFLYPANSIPINVALEIDVHGPNTMFPTACAAGNYAIGYGFDLINEGKSDLMFCGGADAFSRIAFTGFNRLMAMAPEKCQPFDKNRKGMMLGEGAGVLLLELLEHAQSRGAKIYAEILGYGLSCDAHHMTQPSEEGIARCMEKALKNTGVSKDDIDYISAHGTGTPQNDRVECAAMKRVFGEKSRSIPCSSIKSMLGHTMGAASAIEAIACCCAIRNQIVPPTINLETYDEECDVGHVFDKQMISNVELVLNNAYAFGGGNCSAILKLF